MLKVGVLISGRGSNLKALIDAAAQPGFPAEIACVISNKASAEGLKYAEEAQVPAHVINHKAFAEREDFDRAINAVLQAHGVQLICLAGFMRLHTPWFVNEWHDRLVNIHPTLLPAFPGLHVHEAVIKSGTRFSGATVFFVRNGTDDGPIINQAVLPVLADDTPDTLAARILRLEHQIYPQAVRLIAEGRVNIHEDKCFIADHVASDAFIVNPPLS
ncbi:MAG: phosphoribosylglycinamide formyltransferase [Alphaproteobacteria bacterium]|nr:phosphoribosylglycinamide formyltransferase [Alphaproteobacteria bacterium]